VLLGALLFIAFLTAVSSTMDSVLHCASLTLTYDVVKRFFAPRLSEPQSLALARWALWLLPLPALWIALQAPSIFSIIWFAADVYACTVTVPLLALLLLAKPHAKAGQVAFSVGAGGACLIGWVQYAKQPLPFVSATVATTWMTAFTVILASALSYALVVGLERLKPPPLTEKEG
jgi:Na+/proline symporter